MSFIFDTLDVLAPYIFLLVGLIFLGIAGVMIRENLKFAKAVPAEGTIISIIGSGNRTFPTIEYEWAGGKSQFKSTIAAPGARTGQLIDIEINDAGKARIRSPGHAQMATAIALIALPFLAAGVYLISRG